MEKLDSHKESPSEAGGNVELRRCNCPVCGSRDVWKWGQPTLRDRLMMTIFNKSPLTCRRCGHKFHRKVVFGRSE